MHRGDSILQQSRQEGVASRLFGLLARAFGTHSPQERKQAPPGRKQAPPGRQRPVCRAGARVCRCFARPAVVRASAVETGTRSVRETGTRSIREAGTRSVREAGTRQSAGKNGRHCPNTRHHSTGQTHVGHVPKEGRALCSANSVLHPNERHAVDFLLEHLHQPGHEHQLTHGAPEHGVGQARVAFLVRRAGGRAPDRLHPEKLLAQRLGVSARRRRLHTVGLVDQHPQLLPHVEPRLERHQPVARLAGPGQKTGSKAARAPACPCVDAPHSIQGHAAPAGAPQRDARANRRAAPERHVRPQEHHQRGVGAHAPARVDGRGCPCVSACDFPPADVSQHLLLVLYGQGRQHSLAGVGGRGQRRH
ncbi:hypothetical protein CLUG_02810 [Clavispora lusitaniae ATCC 42720]|uniref:Uncharacterized protein n=1 Tax=Clavispora lusitaniae (strain ATCC 42720) TaxID=306902 RepID=C4Y2P7_CLAL4|nr:uncharacterized protein CLUG_02810 [Clavispora lusitaniae ATCC 42720]EEQ38684.1 hypothetical protein CLUG_02810 [Clavispora lusitaniae ATCC 42720]